MSAGLAMAMTMARLQAQDPPPLDPPALLPPATTSAPAPVTTPSKPRMPRPEENRSLLVIPGVTAPIPPRRETRTPAPFAKPDARKVPAPAPLTLEPILEDADAETEAEKPVTPTRPRLSSSRPPNEPASSSQPAQKPAGSRGPTMFGRLFAPLGASETLPDPESSSISVEPRSDPAAEAALKRKVEKQVQQTLGDRVRSVDVRVAGRTVVIRAQATRFWQRRGVRRSLETLPLPSGYRGRVEMQD